LVPNAKKEITQREGVGSAPRGIILHSTDRDHFRHRISQNFLAQFLSVALHAGNRIVGVAVALAFWDKNIYGDWLLLYGAMDYLIVSDLGVTHVVASEMTIQLAAGKSESVRSLFTSSLVYLIGNRLLLLAGVLIACKLLPFGSFLGIREFSSSQVNAIILVLATHALLVPFIGIVMGVFRAVGKNARGVVYFSSILFMETMCGCFGIYRGLGPFPVALIYLGVRAIMLVVMYFDAMKNASFMRPDFRTFSLAPLKRMVLPALSMQVGAFGTAITNQGYLVIVARIFGSSAVVNFATMRTLSRLVIEPSRMASSSVGPEVSRAFGQGNTDRMRKISIQSLRFSFWLNIFGAVLAIAFGRLIFNVWTHGKIILSYSIFLPLLASIMLNILGAMATHVLSSINRHIKVTILFAISSGIGVFVCGFLYPPSTCVGVAIVMLFCELGYFAYALLKLSESLQINWKHLLAEVVRFPPFSEWKALARHPVAALIRTLRELKLAGSSK
jgi:O-antigen/teichoic acid export membrane protein